MQEKRTYLEINLKQYRQNLKNIRKLVGNDIQVMAVIKADGYGLGATALAQAAIQSGVSYLGVANLYEAEEILQIHPQVPIFILSEPFDKKYQDIVNLGLVQTIYTKTFADQLDKTAQKVGKKVVVHLKVDTGMNRIGCDLADALDFVRFLQSKSHLQLNGIFTHLANADDLDSDYNRVQIEKFLGLKQKLEAQNIKIPIYHAANSDATLNYPQSRFDLVRIGIASYKDVMTLKSRVGFIKEVPAASAISYGGEYKTGEKTQIATIMIGYGDGYPKSLSNKGKVYIKGQVYPIVGRVCMDMLMIDIGPKNNKIRIGDEAVLIGDNLHPDISMQKICELTKKISYEIMCGMQKRVLRIYQN